MNWRLMWVQSRIAFVPRDDDIYIAGYPRSGTTWLQMILYQLMTRGKLDFSHIDAVIPFLEHSVQVRRDLNRISSPRVIKTHLRYRQLQIWPGRYIYVERDGRSAAVSIYHYYLPYGPSKFPFNEYFESFLAGKIVYGSWFRYVSEWRSRGPMRNVLFIRYEDLITDFVRCVSEISQFCKLKAAPGDLSRIAEYCRFDFMRKYEYKFGGPGIEEGTFIREGKRDGWKQQLTDDQIRAFENKVRSLPEYPVSKPKF
jgi:hypothetical protein